MIPSDDFGSLLRWLQDNEFQVILVDGPRGSGKTTLCDRLLSSTDLSFYKTWGRDQRERRAALQASGLDLPQGAYFVLDFVSQINLKHPVLIDRSTLSSIVYQYELWGPRTKLHKYYINLMTKCRAVLLSLSSDNTTIYSRRLARSRDEEKASLTVEKVEQDIEKYEIAAELLINAGLREVAVFKIGDSDCYAYITKEMADAGCHPAVLDE